jgi:lactaldehyde dehydrogenase/glycolaldehyde dehydrogenase
MTSLVSLTGSVEAGQRIIEASVENVTKVSLELGGKAPAIVFEDADVDLAVKCILASRILNSGQVCNAAERVYVHENIADTSSISGIPSDFIPNDLRRLNSIESNFS